MALDLQEPEDPSQSGVLQKRSSPLTLPFSKIADSLLWQERNASKQVLAQQASDFALDS